MKLEEVVESRFLRQWVEHELAQFGATPTAFYVVSHDDLDNRILVATDVGVLDLHTTRSTTNLGGHDLSGDVLPWRDIGPIRVTTKTTHIPRGDEPFESDLRLEIASLGLDAHRRYLNPGLDDFARACLQAVARLE